MCDINVNINFCLYGLLAEILSIVSKKLSFTLIQLYQNYQITDMKIRVKIEISK
jgi:hypothetical protein